MPDREPNAVSRFTQAQLDEWAAEPADADTVKGDALDCISKALTPLRGSHGSLELFVQGGYANRTAVTSQSDVDVVVRWHGAVVDKRSDDEEAAESYRRFRDDVVDTLRSQLRRGIADPRVACRCEVGGRHIDVVPCLPYRVGDRDDIWFWPENHNFPTVSWPRTISYLIERRDSEAGGEFRPVVRALKGMRDDFWSGEDTAPGFAIESLVYAAWPAARRRRSVRSRCVAVLSAATKLLHTLKDPTGRQRVTISPPTFDAVEDFVDEALARLS